MKRPTYSTIDEYIADFPTAVQAILQKMRQTIQKAAPKAEEAISYQIPAFKLNGKVLIYFAAFKNHVSVYPAPRGAAEFKDKLAKYKGGKGTVQFPFEERVPYDLIRQIVKFKLKQNLKKAAEERRKG
jgi:uncharacterized protein YdhG (YjbR/CyaY superfamily)